MDCLAFSAGHGNRGSRSMFKLDPLSSLTGVRAHHQFEYEQKRNFTTVARILVDLYTDVHYFPDAEMRKVQRLCLVFQTGHSAERYADKSSIFFELQQSHRQDDIWAYSTEGAFSRFEVARSHLK